MIYKTNIHTILYYIAEDLFLKPVGSPLLAIRNEKKKEGVSTHVADLTIATDAHWLDQPLAWCVKAIKVTHITWNSKDKDSISFAKPDARLIEKDIVQSIR